MSRRETWHGGSTAQNITLNLCGTDYRRVSAATTTLRIINCISDNIRPIPNRQAWKQTRADVVMLTMLTWQISENKTHVTEMNRHTGLDVSLSSTIHVQCGNLCYY